MGKFLSGGARTEVLPILRLEPLQSPDIIRQHVFVERIPEIPPFFLAVDQPGVRQDLYMMGDRRLCQVYYVSQIRALPAASLIGKVVQDLQAVHVAQRLRDFFDLFKCQCHNIALINANISIFNQTTRLLPVIRGFLTFCLIGNILPDRAKRLTSQTQ